MSFNNGYIEERQVEQVFSIDDNMFLPDRYIIGTCPYCGADNARGDQCESCTKVLDPKDLIDARSAVSGSKNLEVRKTSHLYLKLSKLELSTSVLIIFVTFIFCPKNSSKVLGRKASAKGICLF